MQKGLVATTTCGGGLGTFVIDDDLDSGQLLTGSQAAKVGQGSTSPQLNLPWMTGRRMSSILTDCKRRGSLLPAPFWGRKRKVATIAMCWHNLLEWTCCLTCAR